MEEKVRKSAVAGSFYPADPQKLKKSVHAYISSAEIKNLNSRAFIVPHAGFVYSAPIAGSAYKTIERNNQQFKRIVLLGPSHRVAFKGVAVPESNSFETPLGKVKIDIENKNKIIHLPFVTESDVPHQHEHCLEVQLPFIQEVLPDVAVLPIVVGDCEPQAIYELLNLIASDNDTLVLVSSDLSHYHPDNEAKKIDSHTASDIENFNYNNLNGEKACGYIAIQGLLKFAKENQWQSKVLDLRNSGDTAGDKSRVVGYGAFAFYE
ncbi:MAG: AmmeMemoRadiSam system protein B [Bdellovibrionaceae bacterium]|nr:AmmeMemoRadiSam system protein B [Pseudobdellovibrionaceae bacterium]